MKKIFLINLLFISGMLGQTELTLDDCFHIALNNNPSITISELDVESAKTGIQGSYSSILPNISTGLNWSHNNQGEREYYVGGIKEIQPETASNSYNFGLSYNQTIYDGGGGWNQIKLAKNNFRSAKASQKQLRQNLRVNIAKQFYNILKAKQLLQVYKKSLKTSQQQLKKTEEMYKLGQVAKKDLFKAKVQKGNDELNIIKQSQNISALKHEIAQLMGYKSSDFIIIEKEYTAPRKYHLDTSLEKTFANNMELQNLKFEKTSANLQYNLSKSKLSPSLSTNISYSKGGSQLDRIYSDVDKFWNTSIGLNLNIPLFQGFSRKTDIQQAQISYQQYDARIKSLKLEIIQRIKNSHENLTTYDKMLAINKLNLQSAKEDLRSAQENYQLQNATILEVLDAQANLAEAQSNLIETKYNAKIAEMNLRYNLGQF